MPPACGKTTSLAVMSNFYRIKYPNVKIVVVVPRKIHRASFNQTLKDIDPAAYRITPDDWLENDVPGVKVITYDAATKIPDFGRFRNGYVIIDEAHSFIADHPETFAKAKDAMVHVVACSASIGDENHWNAFKQEWNLIDHNFVNIWMSRSMLRASQSSSSSLYQEKDASMSYRLLSTRSNLNLRSGMILSRLLCLSRVSLKLRLLSRCSMMKLIRQNLCAFSMTPPMTSPNV